MVKRDFEEWLGRFYDTIYGYAYYTDFQKVDNNMKDVKAPLNAMNALLGSDNLDEDFKTLVKEYPAVLRCLPLLIAKREKEIKIYDKGREFNFDFENPNQSAEMYLHFMKKTGLYYLIQEHRISNLFDYATGIEVGLDSNARKNRGGHVMENLIEDYLKKANLKYHKEMYISEIEEKYGLDLSPISNMGKSVKRFDFVIEGTDKIYGLEVNFYSSGGSKLNETARSYKMIAEESEEVDNFVFVWITDGKGWKSARKNLQETFDVLKTIYCIRDMQDGTFLMENDF